MAFIDIDRTYQSNKVPTQQDLDNIVDGVEAFLNVTGISDDNIQDSSVTASTKFIDASVTQSKMGTGAVEAAQIQALAVTTDKFNNEAVATSKIADSNITNAQLANNAVDTINILSGAIDPIHITANKAVSTTPSNATSSGSYVTVNTATITSTGGPVLLFLTPIISDSTISLMYYNASSHPSGTAYSYFKLLRDGVAITPPFTAYYRGADTFSNDNIVGSFGPGSVVFLDTPSAGSHTYTCQLLNNDPTIYTSAINVNLIAWEI